MYQYTTTNIINSSLDSNGTTAKYAGSTTDFTVTRVGKFLVSNIVSIDKRPYTAGVKEVCTVTVPTLTGTKVARLTVQIGLDGKTYGEYADSYTFFNKPIVVEVIASGTAATDAAALAAAFNSIKNRFGTSYAVATVNSADIVLTAVDNAQRFLSVIVSEEGAYNGNSMTLYDYTTKATGTVGTPGRNGFGDDAWMLKTVYVPTPENQRYWGLNKEGQPVLGANYTQYTLRYSFEKSGDDGIVSGLKSVTTHVFYVANSLVSGFEAEIIKTGISLRTTGALATDVSITSGTMALTTYGTGSPYTITYSTTPSGLTGGVWSLNSAGNVDAANSDADFSKVSITNAGVITLVTGHALANNDKIGVKVVLDGVTITKQISVVT